MQDKCLRILIASLISILAACDQVASNAADGGVDDADSGGEEPVGCPQNWTREHDYEPYTSLLHIEDGALVMEANTMGVSVQTPLTSEDSGANVMRFEFSRLALGAGGEFRLAFHTEDLAQAILTVTESGAHLAYPPELNGLEFDLPFVSSPTHATIEFHQTDEGLRTYANFFEAGDNQVLTGVLNRGSVYAHLGYVQINLVGLLARAVMERYVHYDETSTQGYADDFNCDSLAEPNRLGWSTTRYVDLGATCTSDAQCGAADSCVDGRCRRPCFSSRVCGRQVCFAHPDGAGYCRLAENEVCNLGECPDGLVCGVDGECRMPCEGGREAYSTDFSDLAGTCGLNYVSCNFGDTCVETSKFRCVHGACADDDEEGATEAGGWGCGYGAVRCSNDNHRIEQCNMNGPGFQQLEFCGDFSNSCSYACPGPDDHEYRCATGTTSPMPRCSTCARTCERTEDVIDYCLGTTDNVAVDCETGFSWCSFGPGGDLARRHPGDLPYFQAECESVVSPVAMPERIAITPPGGSSVAPFQIDRTEVSRAQYVGFLQSRPHPHDVPPSCAYNTSLLPGSGVDLGDWPWFERPDRPAMVDWCDAWAYCQWAGGHLCGELGGGPVANANLSDPSHDAWAYVCTVGGTRPVPYGSSAVDGVCDSGRHPYSDIGTHPGCTSDVVGFAGLMDMPGNGPEWQDGCIPGAATDGSQDLCPRTGGDCTSTENITGAIPGGVIRCCYE